MALILLAVLGSVVLSSVVARPAEADDSRSSPAYVGAPVLVRGQTYAGNMPDPAIVFDGATYWAYTTSTGGPFLPVFSSTDLQTWTVRSDNTLDAFPVKPSWAAPDADDQWAPGVIINGSEWLVYSSWPMADGRRCISVAGGTSAIGPFVDNSSVPLWCDDGDGSIDPAPYRGADGRLYLTWKAEAAPGRATLLFAAQLTSDGRSLIGSTRTLLLGPTQSWERGVVENPSMAVIGGSWWLLYSGAAWDSGNYRMGAARCSGPLGPCTKVASDPLFGNTASDLGPGGGAFFVDATGRTRIVYHAWNAPYTRYPDCAQPQQGYTVCANEGQRFLRFETAIPANGRLTVDPFGLIDRVSPGGGSITVDGWALDPSSTAPIDVHVHVDGVSSASTAARERSDLAALFPGAGTAHGFSVTVPASFGPHNVCVYAINTGMGTNQLLGCRTVTVTSGPPFGVLDVVSAGAGSISVSGWAIDPDTSGPVMVHVYVYSSLVESVSYATLADRSRPDVGALYPGYGSAHGFSARYSTGAGPRAACAYAINVGAGSHTLLGCQLVIVPDASPFGSLDVVSAGPGSISVSGWAIDPETNDPLMVHVYVWSSFTESVSYATPADRSRPDVAAAFGQGANHGYAATYATGPGPRLACVYAINVGIGNHSLVGCRLVVVPDASPFGVLDVVSGGQGTISVSGWAIDPDAAGPVMVHVYVYSSLVESVSYATLADRPRPDVAAVFGGGANRGFAATYATGAGPRAACAYAINSNQGSTTLLGCRLVTVT